MCLLYSMHYLDILILKYIRHKPERVSYCPPSLPHQSCPESWLSLNQLDLAEIEHFFGGERVWAVAIPRSPGPPPGPRGRWRRCSRRPRRGRGNRKEEGDQGGSRRKRGAHSAWRSRVSPRSKTGEGYCLYTEQFKRNKHKPLLGFQFPHLPEGKGRAD